MLIQLVKMEKNEVEREREANQIVMITWKLINYKEETNLTQTKLVL